MTAVTKILLLLPIALLLMSCGERPLTTTQSNNPGLPVSLLFEYEGCKVYRFYDGRTVYYTNCNSVMQSVKEGKTEVYREVK